MSEDVMATIERFEQIEAWQEARRLTDAIYALMSEGKFSRDFGLRDQIRRAAVSVMSNIAEDLSVVETRSSFTFYHWRKAQQARFVLSFMLLLISTI